MREVERRRRRGGHEKVKVWECLPLEAGVGDRGGVKKQVKGKRTVRCERRGNDGDAICVIRYMFLVISFLKG